MQKQYIQYSSLQVKYFIKTNMTIRFPFGSLLTICFIQTSLIKNLNLNVSETFRNWHFKGLKNHLKIIPMVKR